MDLKVYPNPLSTRTTIETTTELRDARIIVANSPGQIVKDISRVNSSTLTFDRHGSPSGMYFVRLIQENRVVASTNVLITDRHKLSDP
ncbi:T9SS type A sorting domain-containing protein [Cryomorphaceae bacterium 1068]|nr:T9SS type A sorting domain-containing protein [Cryomorphaceae bacterium 1068]